MRTGIVDNQTATSCQVRCVVMVWYDDGRWSDILATTSCPTRARRALVSTSPSVVAPVTRKSKSSSWLFFLAAFCGQPPLVLHTKMFGRRQLKYRANSQVRYYCEPGFIQRQNPIITCQSNGQWEEPMITCSPGEKCFLLIILYYLVIESKCLQCSFHVFCSQWDQWYSNGETGNMAHRSEQGNNHRRDNNKNNNTWICGYKWNFLKQAHGILSLSCLSCHPFVYPS